MGIERLSGAKKKLKATRKNRNQPFAVRLTPHGSKTHVRIGTMNAECSGISIAESSDGMIFVEYNELAKRQRLGDGTSLIRVEEKDAELLHQMMLQEINAYPRLAKRRAKANVTKHNAESRRLEREVKELRKQNQKMQRQINNEAGTLIELQLTGIVPLGEEPPIPLKHIQQMKYGCDWLSVFFRGNTLHLFFIESNLSRNGDFPTFNKNETRFKNAIKKGKVRIEYHHHWVDHNGETHWE